MLLINMTNTIEVIDLFAGPGGLGEGFSAYKDSAGNHPFKIKLSVEKDVSAHQTLMLRAFYRQFHEGSVPDEYYRFLEGKFGKDPSILYKNSKFSKEANAAATEARLLTLGEHNNAIHSSISSALGGYADCWAKPWVLIGGPPCQAYSIVGRSRNAGKSGYVAEKDHRNFLYKEYLKVIAKYRPTVFVMENVKGLLSAKVGGLSMFEEIRRDLQCPGKAVGSDGLNTEYIICSLTTTGADLFGSSLEPTDFVIKSELYGIPQARHRVILLGIRRDAIKPDIPTILELERAFNVKKIINDLPKLRSGLSKSEDSFENWAYQIQHGMKATLSELRRSGKFDLAYRIEDVLARINKKPLGRGTSWSTQETSGVSDSGSSNIKDWYKDPTGWMGVCNHDTRSHMTEDLHRYLFCACFGQLYSTSEKFTPKAADFPRSLAPEHVNWDSGYFVDRFRVQNASRVATTITSHISKDGHYFIHYDPLQCRSLTVREAARIQTFPDNYFFMGNRTQQYVQVGNAVPPYLAYKIAEVVWKIMK